MRTEPELDVVDPLAAGREALGRGEWEHALAYFEAASERNDSAEAFNVVGQGSAPNFTVRGVVHTTVNANGDVTALVDHFRSTGDCSP